jgi:hypothetical protein
MFVSVFELDPNMSLESSVCPKDFILRTTEDGSLFLHLFA